MSDAAPTGPLVGDQEDLYRALTHPAWWKPNEGRASSAAFNWPKFSVDIASLTTAELTLATFLPGTGLVSFQCGEARQLGFQTHHEIDVNHPENAAHAHVYFAASSSKRKTQARRLAEASRTTVIRPPQFT